MEKTLVFIDCGFLSKVSKHFGGGKKQFLFTLSPVQRPEENL